ncbi:hypothetical protein [Gemmata sp.]|uniref:hypothetical protein n=1 Tax=Gemmata sp. TaxID=1914242 RepID=UPI003F6FA857
MLPAQKPPYTLLGRRLEAREGERLVRGTLRLRQHGPDRVNATAVPAWWEIRVEEERGR